LAASNPAIGAEAWKILGFFGPAPGHRASLWRFQALREAGDRKKRAENPARENNKNTENKAIRTATS